MASISGLSTALQTVNDNATITPFTGLMFTPDPAAPGTTPTYSVTIATSDWEELPSYPYYENPGPFGTISDPAAGSDGSQYNAGTGTYTVSGLTSPSQLDTIIGNLVYTPPSLPNGAAEDTGFTVSVGQSGSIVASASAAVWTDTAPAILNTAANQPVASGATLTPFASVGFTDHAQNGQDTASFTVSDNGAATDADGLLTGNGLSKTGVGTYSLGVASRYTLESELQKLVFTPSAVAAGQTRTTGIALAVAGTPDGLTSTDTTTSVLTIGPAVAPTAPLITGTLANQSVEDGNSIAPFHGVTVSDTNATKLDSATITLGGGAGTLSGAGLTAASATTYTLAATDPTTLTSELDALVFKPAALGGAAARSTTMTLQVTDNGQTATDTTTSVVDNPLAPPAPQDFIIADQTTGVSSTSNGEAYSGPVSYLQRQLIDPSADNVNLTANVPNVFLHSGSGEDALQAMGGQNVLDGSTGSNFLTGGSGTDTFFVDDRAAPAAIWSTVNNFHGGDAATVWGITPADFTLTWANSQGAAGFTGLTLDAAAPGKPDAKLTLVGYSTADLSNGKLTVGFGTDAASGSPFMMIQGA